MLVALCTTLDTALDEVAGLIQASVLDHPNFIEDALRWFAGASGRTLQVPTLIRSAIAAEAAFASASKKGYKDPSLPAHLRGRKAQAATLAVCLARTEKSLREEAVTAGRRLDDAREKLVQLLAVSSRIEPILLEETVDKRLQALTAWKTIASNGPDTRAMVAYLRLAVAPIDRLLLIAEILSQATTTLGDN
jgi:hypothetical protein